MKYTKNRRVPDGLESKVSKNWPNHDGNGKYIPYCDFNYHMGIILDESVCKERDCQHYLKLYLKDGR